MKVKSVRLIFDRVSLNKYVGCKNTKNLQSGAEHLFFQAMKVDSEIEKVIIKGRGCRRGHGYGGMDLVIVKANDKYRFLPGKKARATIDKVYMHLTSEDSGKKLLIRMFNDCMKKLGI